MKRLWVLAAVLCILVYAAPAEAQLKAQGLYIGASGGAGLTKLSIDEIDLIDDTSLVWKAAVGYRMRFLAFEIDYRSMSKVKALFPGSEVAAQSKGFTGSALLILPAGPIDFFARGGGHYATSEIGVGADIGETKAWSLLYGAGLGIRVGSFALRFEYERPQIEVIPDLHQLTVGFTIAF
jgi:hypothetical protein